MKSLTPVALRSCLFCLLMIFGMGQINGQTLTLMENGVAHTWENGEFKPFDVVAKNLPCTLTVEDGYVLSGYEMTFKSTDKTHYEDEEFTIVYSQSQVSSKDAKIINGWQKKIFYRVGSATISNIDKQSHSFMLGLHSNFSVIALITYRVTLTSVKAICTPVEPTAVNSIDADAPVRTTGTKKVLKNGKLVIVDGTAEYNVAGARIK